MLLAASCCPVAGTLLMELHALEPSLLVGAALGAFGAWWFTIPFHAEPPVAKVARWSFRAVATIVLGFAVALFFGSDSMGWAILGAAYAGALLKLAYLRVYFRARSNSNVRLVGLATGSYLASVLAAGLAASIVLLLGDSSSIGFLGAILLILFSALSLLGAWLFTGSLLVSAAQGSKLSRVEWWLSEATLPHQLWAALVWHGLDAAEVYGPDGQTRVFSSAYEAINWLAANSYVDRDTAVARQLVGVHEVPVSV